MIKVAYIVPIYNVNKYLYECLKSLDEIKTNKQIILINDSSVEDPSEIVKQFLSVNKRFFYFKNDKNMGLGFSRNKGLDVLESDVTHVYFVDSDDIVNSQAIDRVVLKMKKNYSYLMSKFFAFSKKGVENVAVKSFTLSNTPYSAWGSFWVAETAKRTRFKSRTFEDASWVIDFFKEYEFKTEILSEETYSYRKRISSISHSRKRDTSTLVDSVNALSKIYNSKIYGWNYSKTEMLLFEYLKINKKDRHLVSLPKFKINYMQKMWIYFAFYMQKFVFFEVIKHLLIRKQFFD